MRNLGVNAEASGLRGLWGREFEAVPFTVRSFTARAYNRAFRRGGYARRRVNAAL